MTNDKGILIKNIYYMLTYAFQVLKQKSYEEIDKEEFDNIHDMFAEILAKGVAKQIKQGLYREYVEESDNLSVMRGKINMPGTIKNKINRNNRLVCDYDEYSKNNTFNQILKTTMKLLLSKGTLKNDRKKAINKVLALFDGIDVIDNPKSISWKTLKFERNNQNYIMLINICYFIIDGLLMTTEDGTYNMKAFSDEQMCKVYEKFILEYYKTEFPYLHVSAPQIAWDLDEGSSDYLLPVMQSDIVISNETNELIIDAKYYGKSLSTNYDKKTLHSGNLYQIFAYVKNAESLHAQTVSGVLLYAKTNEEIVAECEYSMGGNRIGAKSLNLYQDFDGIKNQLNDIVCDYFNI